MQMSFEKLLMKAGAKVIFDDDDLASDCRRWFMGK